MSSFYAHMKEAREHQNPRIRAKAKRVDRHYGELKELLKDASSQGSVRAEIRALEAQLAELKNQVSVAKEWQTCPQCDKRLFTTKGGLQGHINIKHRKKAAVSELPTLETIGSGATSIPAQQVTRPVVNTFPPLNRGIR